ncbi:hypothetical protein [Mycetocola saprophilus]|uniref:hypothetical protein n=1 Tax=Mycetocola saprophilus TaxID=76636 RepID=UPI0004BF6D51|nr:hypothetical protein [Mycetocola saprophilus]
MSGGEIAIDMAMLRQHAGRVSQVGREVSEAASAAGSQNMGDGAFGVMCAFLVPPATMITDAITQTIRDAAQALDRTAAEVRQVAADVEQREDDIIAQIRDLERDLR